MKTCTCMQTGAPQINCPQCGKKLCEEELDRNAFDREVLCFECEGDYYIAHSTRKSCEPVKIK